MCNSDWGMLKDHPKISGSESESGPASMPSPASAATIPRSILLDIASCKVRPNSLSSWPLALAGRAGRVRPASLFNRFNFPGKYLYLSVKFFAEQNLSRINVAERNSTERNAEQNATQRNLTERNSQLLNSQQTGNILPGKFSRENIFRELGRTERN